MRTLLLLYLAASLFAPSSQPVPPPVGIKGQREQIPKADNQQSATENGPPKAAAEAPSGAAQARQSPTEPDANQTKGQAQKTWHDYLGDGLAPSTWSNWALVLIGGLAARVAIGTLREIKDQARTARIGLKAARVATSAATVSARAARESADTARFSADLAEKALQLTERADVLLESIGLSSPDSPPNTMGPQTVITLVFRNFGRTRANDVHLRFWLGVPGANPLPEPPRIPTVLASGDTQIMPFPQIGDSVNQETFNRVIDGTVPLQFTGEVTYKDVFGFAHRTTCEGTFRPKPLGFDVDRNEAT